MAGTVEILTTPSRTHPTYAVADPYRYGWRYVQRDHADGTYTMEQVGLTLEDVLHPQEGDQVTHSDAHQRRRRYLCNVIEAQLAQDPSAVVLDDVRIAWDVPDLKPHGPDIAVILSVSARKNWSTFDVTTEGVRPALIIEITSPETASIDRSNKLEEYDLAGVPLYIIVDTVVLRKQPMLRLLGYTQTPNGYQVLVPNEHGWLWLAPAHVWLGVDQHELVCYDEQQQPLGDYRALAAALSTAEQRATDAERRAIDFEQRAVDAEARIRELEAELRRAKVE